MVGLAGITVGRLRRVLTAMLVVLLAASLAGCATVTDVAAPTGRPFSTGPIIEATAILPPEITEHGQPAQVEVGGWVPFSGLSLLAVRYDADGKPVAMVGLPSHNPKDPITEYPLHLGETVSLDDWVSVTLVSFDNDGAQAVTFLFNG